LPYVGFEVVDELGDSERLTHVDVDAGACHFMLYSGFAGSSAACDNYSKQSTLHTLHESGRVTMTA